MRLTFPRTLTPFAMLLCSSGLLIAHPGDFDNNGRDDLVLHVPYEDIEGDTNPGVLQVIYGRNGGLKANGDQLWHQNVPGIAEDCDNNELFGWSTAAGDFDGDGRDDLAIGVTGQIADGYDDAGAVHVLYGTNNGLQAAGDQFFSRATTGVKGDPNTDAGFGYALAAGDFDGDGFDDLAIGVPFHDVGTLDGHGEVNILYGSPSGLSAQGDQVFSQDSAGLVDSAEDFDNFGWFLSSGDFDGDGHDDLAVSAPFETIDPGELYSGAVHILYGSNSGLSASGDQLWHQNSPGIGRSCTNADYFGHVTAVGDFDDDGFDDLAIGVPHEDVNGVVDAGAVHVLYGSSNGLRAQGDQFFTQNTPGIANSSETSDRFGAALAAGDFDGDGRDDLAIGVTYEDLNGIDACGALHVLFGSAQGLRAAGDRFFHQGTAGLAGDLAVDNLFGAFLQVGDYDGDGRDDLAVSAPYETVGAATYAGTITVLYGSGNGPSTTGEQRWHQNSSGIADTAEFNDTLGDFSPGAP